MTDGVYREFLPCDDARYDRDVSGLPRREGVERQDRITL